MDKVSPHVQKRQLHFPRQADHRIGNLHLDHFAWPDEASGYLPRDDGEAQSQPSGRLPAGETREIGHGNRKRAGKCGACSVLLPIQSSCQPTSNMKTAPARFSKYKLGLGGLRHPAAAACSHRIAGFTLVELLVVIAILAVLAALAIPGGRRVIESSNASKCVSNLRQLYTAANQWSADNDGWMLPTFPSGKNADGRINYGWVTALFPYLSPGVNLWGPSDVGKRPKGVLGCPSSKWLVPPVNTGWCSDYGKNGFVNEPIGATHNERLAAWRICRRSFFWGIPWAGNAIKAL